MKYNDNGTIKDIVIKAGDTLPVGTVVSYDGETIPSGWEEVTEKGRLSLYKIPTVETSTATGTGILNGAITTTGGDLLVNLNIGSFKTSGGNSYAVVQIDGSQKGRIVGTNRIEYASESGTLIVSDIPAGTHTFEILIIPNSGYTAYVGPYNAITASVVEL